jgi:ABC-type glycerol-3-phosphate transport system permease component
VNTKNSARLFRFSRWRHPLLAILAFLVAALFAFPFLWMVLTSLKGPREIFTSPVRFFPTEWYFQAYIDLLSKGNFPQYFWNSIYVATITTGIAVIISALAGLGFARYKFPGRNYLLLGILLSQLFPLVLLVPPFYVLMQQLSILDSLLSLIIAYTSFALPYSVWMLTGYFRSIPVDLEESAMIDGATRFGAYARVTFPLAAPGIVATIIYCFILAWNEFLFATTFISSPSQRTLPIGLQSFIGQYTTEWNLLMAGSIVTTLPVVVLFIVLQRYLVAGLTAGAMKG